MLCINRNETDPWFNLAAEEYVLRSFTDDCFMLWRNEPSIIVGKHQNTLAEINHNFVREHGIRVVRRISGGGAVYHDQGNINFSFVANGEKDKLVDFRRFTKPILEVLVNLGVDARFEGHNDLKINGMKFSGNAEHVYKNRVLHHGTLLFDSDLEMINQALTIDSEKFSDKAVKSIRSKVKNISYHLPGQMEITDFMDIVLNHVLKSHPDATLYSFDELDYERIEELVRTKYSTWEWNYGSSPNYTFRKSINLSGEALHVEIRVRQGIIENVDIHINELIIGDFKWIISNLVGLPHDYEKLFKVFRKTDQLKNWHDRSVDEFTKAFF